MKEQQDYIRDIAEIRSMMERSSKFLSLSGLAGVMAGIYALTGAWVASSLFDFNPGGIFYSGIVPESFRNVIILAIAILLLTIGTAIFLSHKKAGKIGEKLWNAIAKQLVFNMLVPLITGGILMIILISREMIGLVAPFSLLFYGLALFNGSQFTYREVKSLGIIEIILGLISIAYVEYGLICWAIGFGLFHILYGIYVHFKYER
jgi:hypothetical protein